MVVITATRGDDGEGGGLLCAQGAEDGSTSTININVGHNVSSVPGSLVKEAPTRG